MTTPSLALGIGLQGKPIDRAAFNMQREIGAQKALQRKQDKELKELEPFKKQLIDLQSKAYLPAQKELLARETAKVYKYMADNIGNIDQWQLSQMVGELANRSGLYQRNYIEAEKIRNDPNYQHLQPEIEKIFSISSPESFNEIGAQNPVFGFSLNQLGGLNMQPFEAKAAQKTAQDFINSQRDKIFAPPTVETIDGIQKEVYRPKEGTFESVLDFTVKDPTTYRFEANNLYNQLAKSGNLPNMKTDEGKQQFDQMVKDKIANDIRSLTDFADYKNVPKKGGLTINMGGETADGEILAPGQSSVRINDNYSAPLYSNYSLGNKELTIPAGDKTFRLGGGRITRANKATYNTVGVTYRVAKDKSFTTPQGNFVLREGTLVPEEELERLLQNGVDIQPDAVAFFRDANGTWGYDVATSALQSYFLGESKDDKPRIEMINKELNKKIKELNAIKRKSSSPKKDTPAPKKPTNEGNKKVIKGF